MNSDQGESQSDLAVTDSEADSYWTIGGFEAFDLLVMSLQAVILFFAVPLEPVLSHPAFQFVVGVGFFITIIMLSRTRIYAQGVQMIKAEQEHLWALIFVGGSVLGILVLTVFTFGPIKKMLDYFGADSSWLPIPGIPLCVVALGLLPFLSQRAESRNLEDSSQFKSYPPVVFYLGRGMLLLLASLILYQMYQSFIEDKQVHNILQAIGMMTLFYIPVRLQEMFLHPFGPHFRSLFQTLIFLALGTGLTGFW